MQQRFDSRKYSIQDFETWHKNGELDLSPKFQRRPVWDDKARSFLIDTIIRGKPIPKIFMRQDVNPTTRRTHREVVDGQQRLRTIISFLSDGFQILKIHNSDYPNMRFSELDPDTQTDILQYELSVDLLQNVSDKEIYDIFARLNTYSVVLNPQEKRNGYYFGEFKTTVYELSADFINFWMKIFKESQISRMAEAELVSELLIAITLGIRDRSRNLIDNFYKTNEDQFPNPSVIPSAPTKDDLQARFSDTMDYVITVSKDANTQSKLLESRLVYPLFCSFYHMQYGLPGFSVPRTAISPTDLPKIQSALEHIDLIFEKVKQGEQDAKRHQLTTERSDSANRQNEEFLPLFDDVTEYDEDEEAPPDKTSDDSSDEDEENRGIIEGFDPLYLLTPEERQFYTAYNIRWVHAANRRIQTEYICRLILNSLNQ